ncbi:MAG: rhodanese-related sulfurtransferase [Candidatus Dependentiae bacterium]|nr:rhodanese-related sulfurtransferase [Candidatus Dependentiae bacterium]
MGIVLLFYKYVTIPEPKRFAKWQTKICQDLNLRGRVLIAQEGINGTLGGTTESIERYKAIMREHESFADMDFKENAGSAEDFPRLRIATRNTIVNLGVDPRELTARDGGTHLTPQEVHTLLLNKPDDLIILDTRNMVESAVGKFTDAVIPPIKYFRDFPEYIDKNIDLFKDKQVLMYCTGGIRCERASAYLNVKGVSKKVFQIQGGIHRYAEQYPNGFFRGKNYVFDNRIATKVNDDILGTCGICNISYDDYTNCLNALCNKHFICCVSCKEQLAGTCSVHCQTMVFEKKAPTRPEFGALNTPR